MKKLLVFILAGIMSMQTVYAEVVKNEEFGEEKAAERYGIIMSGGNISFQKVPNGATEITAAVIKDSISAEGVSMLYNLDDINGSFSVETKIRISGMMTNLNIMLGEGSTTLAKVNIGVAGEVNVSDGSEFIRFMQTTAKVNNWIGFKFAYYPSEKRLDVRCNNEIITGLKPYPDYSGEGFDKIIVKTGTGTPEVAIDFIKIEKGGYVNAGVTPITPVYTEPPVPHAVDGIINVKYNGEYKFFDYQPVIRNSRVLIPFRRIFAMLGMEISYDEETGTATGKNADYEIKITAGNNKAYVNGTSYELDVTPEIIENSFYVPVRFVSQTIGKNVEWDNEERTVIIED